MKQAAVLELFWNGGGNVKAFAEVPDHFNPPFLSFSSSFAKAPTFFPSVFPEEQRG